MLALAPAGCAESEEGGEGGGLTILLVEQSVHAAFSVADHVCVLDRGRVAMRGDPATLAGAPRVQAAYLGGGYAAAGKEDSA